LGENWKTAKIAYELRKLRERGAIKKVKTSHYYRLTDEGYYGYFIHFTIIHILNPLISASYKKELKRFVDNPSKIESAYAQINKAVSVVMTELGMVA